jgi:hypothetical protein
MAISHSSWIDNNAMCDETGNVYTRLIDKTFVDGLESVRAPVQEITNDARLAGRFPLAHALPDGAQSRTFSSTRAESTRWQY